MYIHVYMYIYQDQKRSPRSSGASTASRRQQQVRTNKFSMGASMLAQSLLLVLLLI